MQAVGPPLAHLLSASPAAAQGGDHTDQLPLFDHVDQPALFDLAV